MSVIERIRRRIRDRDYYLSGHAEEEMVEDGFARYDMECAILNGVIDRRLTEDPRGTRYRIEGPASDGREMGVLCRLRDDGSLIIITVYAKDW